MIWFSKENVLTLCNKIKQTMSKDKQIKDNTDTVTTTAVVIATQQILS